ncbi:ROK family transcriptional regulator [Nocardia cyriacigeorgica]|uniref:ROK family transcriptional regulator n=1 Tax=Nocardia cyriacigeorgica TaxID=135487 RepID=UPI002455296A|nr:ROK family transcriptional regulator [Nocardia cyriacigeorgica]
MADGSAGSVLRAVLELGPAPRSVIARHAALSPATLTWQARALVEAGLLVELPETTGAGIGRPFSPLELDIAGNVAVAVHIAAGQTTVAVVDLGGGLRSTIKLPHTSTAPEVVLAAAAAEVRRVREELSGVRILGLGVSTGGWVDTVAGKVVHHSFLGWRDVAVRDYLTAHTGLRAELDNHTRALAHAEQLFGRTRGAASSIVLFVGNVIDAAFSVHGQVHYGPRSAAGSIARLLGTDNALAHGVPRRPLDELADHALVSAALARSAIGAPEFPALLTAAGARGTLAHALFLDRAFALGGVVAALVDLLDPDAVVIADRGFGLPGIADAYLAAVGEQSVVCANPEQVVFGSSFQGRILEMSAAAVVLHGVFDAPLTALASRVV